MAIAPTSSDTLALELKARLALLAAPSQALSESALAKLIGNPKKAIRDQALAALAANGHIIIEAGRRGRRVRLTETGARLAGMRVPPRARFTGATVNALLALLGPAITEAPLRDRVLEAHARLAAGPSRMVGLRALRDALASVPASDLEATLRTLESEGVLALGRALDLAALDDETRAAAIDDPLRGPLVFVSRPPVAPVAEATP